MDWKILFALLVVVAPLHVIADGSKKKIRIHLPQKVKHIHHHKKIYITNHPASSQYAPAYLPSAEGAVAVPTNVALPAVASIVPLNSVELIEDSQTRLPGIAQAASKILPLYRARGYYGPNQSEWDDKEYNLVPPPEPADHAYIPTAFSAPSATGAASSYYPSKRVKVVKVNEPPRKKIIRKGKSKRVILRGRPQTEEEHPVSTFHEQFYSDLEGSGTMRKVKKPQRVEKIIDGDTEHIHTYSEEHIHKIVYDDTPKFTGVVGIDAVGSMSALSAARPLIPIKTAQTVLAIPSDTLAGLASVDAIGAQPYVEYAGYNPRDVTHDHIFHDHGEIPANMEITKEAMGLPPKVSYNSEGLRIGGSSFKRHKTKQQHKQTHPTKPILENDFSYYESIYTPINKVKNPHKAVAEANYPDNKQNSFYESPSETTLDDYRPIPSFKFKDKRNNKIRNVNSVSASYYGKEKQTSEYNQQASVPAPFSVSSTVIHDYKPKNYGTGMSAPTGLSHYKDPLANFKDSYSNNHGYDTFASSSNLFTSEDINEKASLSFRSKKGKKKTKSSQNVNFGELDHRTLQYNLESLDNNNDSPTGMETFDTSKSRDISSPTLYTIKKSSPAYQYYTAMAMKALHGDQMSVPEASNNNYQYAEAPTASTLHTQTVMTTTMTPSHYNDIKHTDNVAVPPLEFASVARRGKKLKEKNKNSNTEKTRQKYSLQQLEPSTRNLNYQYSHEYVSESSTARGKLKYGDKI